MSEQVGAVTPMTHVSTSAGAASAVAGAVTARNPIASANIRNRMRLSVPGNPGEGLGETGLRRQVPKISGNSEGRLSVTASLENSRIVSVRVAVIPGLGSSLPQLPWRR